MDDHKEGFKYVYFTLSHSNSVSRARIWKPYSVKPLNMITAQITFSIKTNKKCNISMDFVIKTTN